VTSLLGINIALSKCYIVRKWKSFAPAAGPFSLTVSPVPAFPLLVSNHSYKTSLIQMWHSAKLSCWLQENRFNPQPDFYTLWLPKPVRFCSVVSYRQGRKVCSFCCLTSVTISFDSFSLYFFVWPDLQIDKAQIYAASWLYK